GDRRFAGVDVRRDPDVPRPLEWELAIGRVRIFRRGWFFLDRRGRHKIKMTNDEMSSFVATSSVFRASSFVLRHSAVRLPSEMCECPIGLRHFVRVFAFLYRVALTGGGVFD